jgi:hypothetical protein
MHPNLMRSARMWANMHKRYAAVIMQEPVFRAGVFAFGMYGALYGVAFISSEGPSIVACSLGLSPTHKPT